MAEPTLEIEESPYSAWEKRAFELLVSEMDKRQLTYKDLSLMLEPLGVDVLPDQLNRRVNRMKFSAGFFLACLEAMGVELATQRQPVAGARLGK